MKETTNLKLKKYDYSDNVDMSTGHNLNMDIIDTEIKKVNDKVDSKPTTALGTSFDNSTNGMTATNVQKAIEENKTSILTTNANLTNLKTKVDAGQNWKLTQDGGGMDVIDGKDLNNYKTTCFYVGNCLNSPVNGQYFFIQVYGNGQFAMQIATDYARDTNKQYIRTFNGSWSTWRSL